MSGLKLLSPLVLCAAVVATLAAPAPAEAQQALAFDCPFDDNAAPNPVWTFAGQQYWAVDNTPAVPNTDPNGSGGNNLNYNNGSTFNSGGTNQGTARSPTIDLTGVTSASLSFWCRYQTETTGTSYDQRWIRIYNADSGAQLYNQQFYQTAAAPLNCPSMNSWHQHTWAAMPSATIGVPIQIEFFFNTVDGAINDYQGWFIDDVVVLSDDVTPPDLITDLDAKTPTDTSITLSWSAPFDDDVSGLADNYDLRYSNSPITDANFAQATQVTGEPAPGLPGTAQTVVVGALTAGTTYYFAIQTSDVAGNTSAISNVPTETTTGGAGGGGSGLVLTGPGFEEPEKDILPCSAGTTAAPAGLMALAGLIALAFGLRRPPSR